MLGIIGTIGKTGTIGIVGTIELEAVNKSAVISQSGVTRNYAVFTHHRGNLARPPPQISKNKNDPIHEPLWLQADDIGAHPIPAPAECVLLQSSIFSLWMIEFAGDKFNQRSSRVDLV
jgi:hypothetical protein